MGRAKWSDTDQVVPIFGHQRPPPPVSPGPAQTLRTRGPHVDFHGNRLGRGSFLYEEDSPRESWTARAFEDACVARAVATAVRAGWSRADRDLLAQTLLARCPRAGGIRVGVLVAAYETGPERWAWVRRNL